MPPPSEPERTWEACSTVLDCREQLFARAICPVGALPQERLKQEACEKEASTTTEEHDESVLLLTLLERNLVLLERMLLLLRARIGGANFTERRCFTALHARRGVAQKGNVVTHGRGQVEAPRTLSPRPYLGRPKSRDSPKVPAR